MGAAGPTAASGHAACVELLLGKGAAVDQPNEDGYTPLQLAEKNGHAECAELLLPPGATTLTMGDSLLTLLRAASEQKRTLTDEYLSGEHVQAGAKHLEWPTHRHQVPPTK